MYFRKDGNTQFSRADAQAYTVEHQIRIIRIAVFFYSQVKNFPALFRKVFYDDLL